MFLAFGDESGNHTNESYPFLAIAGYLGPATAWKAFKQAWAEALECFGLQSFHMTDYLSRRKQPYSEWSHQRYEQCLNLLVDVINTYNIAGVAIQVSRDDYNMVLSPRVKKIVTYDPYLLVFDTFITESLRWMYFQPQDEQVTMYFHTTSFASKAKRIYARRRKNDPQGCRLAEDLHFAPDDELLPIQAADLLSNLARNYRRGIVSGGLPITPQIENCLIRLNKKTRTIWRSISAATLKETDEHLLKWLESNPRVNKRRP